MVSPKAHETSPSDLWVYKGEENVMEKNPKAKKKEKTKKRPTLENLMGHNRKGAAKDKNPKGEESEKRGTVEKLVDLRHGAAAAKDKNLNAKKKTKKPGTSENLVKDKILKAEETEKPRVSLAEAAAKMDPSDLADHLDGMKLPDLDVMRFYYYFQKAFAQVSWKWVKMFNESPLSAIIDVPVSHISKPIYELSVDWIKPREVKYISEIILWICDRILYNLVDKGGDNAPASVWPKSQAAHFVVLAMVLRARPDSLIEVLPSLRDKHTYQGPDKLPLIVWMMAQVRVPSLFPDQSLVFGVYVFVDCKICGQASQGDLSAGLYSWMCNLLPLVSNNKCCCPQSLDLILQFADMLSRPEAITVLVNNGGGVMEGQRLVPLPSLDILLRLTFPAPSARVEVCISICEFIEEKKNLNLDEFVDSDLEHGLRVCMRTDYKEEVALSPERAGGEKFALRNLFTFALTLTGEKGNPSVLTKEATSIAIRSLTENIVCFDHWDKLYVDNPVASVALLKKLVDDNQFLRLSTSPIDDTLRVNQIMESFRRKNKRAIAEGGANCFLYKEADKYCTRVSWRLFGRLPDVSAMTVGVVTAASAALSVAAVSASLYLFPVCFVFITIWGMLIALSKSCLCLSVARCYGFPKQFVLKTLKLSFETLYPLEKVPLSHISKPIYELSVDWIKPRQVEYISEIVLWICDRILHNLVNKGGDNAPAPVWPKSQAAHFVVLAMVLRSRPDSLIEVLPSLRDKHTYQGPDKLPLIVWMMAQRPRARTILVDGALRDGEPLFPLPSFEILVRLTFRAPSARVKMSLLVMITSTVSVQSTERVEAIYLMNRKSRNPFRIVKRRKPNEKTKKRSTLEKLMGHKGAKDKNLKAKKKTKKLGTVENLMDRDGATKNKDLKADETEKPIVLSLPEAAAKMDPSHLAVFLDVPSVTDMDVLRFYFYFEKEFAQVSWKWVKMFNESPLSTLIDVPLSHIPEPLYELSVDWIKPREVEYISHIVLWICDRILYNLVAEGGDNAPPSVWPKSQAAHFVVLAMVLRARPDSLIEVLPSLRDKHTYQGPDKLPLIVWMMAQVRVPSFFPDQSLCFSELLNMWMDRPLEASRGDLSAGLYSWMCNLLPLVSNNKSCCPQSLDLVLQFADILSRPEALTILVNGGGVMEGQRLVPLPSLDILLRLTFPAPSARVETTERFEAIYPLLKDVALAPEAERAGRGRYAMKRILTFALTLAGEEGNPVVLAKEATSIAIRALSENVYCFDHWDKIYVDNPEASVALLKKLVDDNQFLRLSTSPSDILTVIVHETMESFRRKNKRAIAEGGANCALYKEADKYCRLISWRLCFRLTPINALVPAAVGAAVGATGAALIAGVSLVSPSL
ncbi:hypothetical protein HID58_073067 [Brassica napus]|uniref:Transmembrane protein n=1 Tax=Brassica napus TaxID=3708 RepID=A0ABQ7Z671_BRANA|nr:hypothetical protein HID58_073067 [Brassica napus]